MPTPWGCQRPIFSHEERARRCIENPENRAVTLRQLRDLREFAKRLCKVGLLKFPQTRHNEELDQVGHRVKWTRISQYEINSEIIKRVIPEEFSCSWAELVANGYPQARRFFCSHSWSEPFRDFMAAIEHHAWRNSVGPEGSYWICVFANDQWRVMLGTRLLDSPFHQALQGSEMTVLLLDKAVEVFTRMWVVFEMTETIRLNQNMEIWTPVGRVGSRQVASGPMVNALEDLETAKAKASWPSDQRQIMNYIAGVNEMEGILQCDDGRKEINPDTDPNYEEMLVAKYRDRFAALDGSIRQTGQRDFASTLKLSRPSLTPHGWDFHHMGNALKDPCRSGITLGQLRAMAQKVRSHFNRRDDVRRNSLFRSTSDQTWRTATLEQVYTNYIKPNITDVNCSYVETITSEYHRPQYVFVGAWKASFEDFMKAIEWHAESRQLPDTIVYWIDLLSLRLSEQPRGAGHHLIAAKVIEEDAYGLVLFVDREAFWSRGTWTTYQIHLAFQHGRIFDIICKDGAMAATRPFTDGSWYFGNMGSKHAQQVLDYDVSQVQMEGAEQDVDRNWLLGIIAGCPDGDGEPPAQCQEYFAFNLRLNSKAAGPVIRAAAFEGDLLKIRQTMALCPGLRLDGAALRGSLGEKALHLAAAQGHTDAMELLLSLGSMPNAPDLMGETPLHWAAFAGQTDAVCLLLEAEADPWYESFDAESPLQVAQQNPAYFLGVETREITQILEDAQKAPKGPESAIGVAELRCSLRVREQQVKTLGAENALLRAIVSQMEKPSFSCAFLKYASTANAKLNRAHTVPMRDMVDTILTYDQFKTMLRQLGKFGDQESHLLWGAFKQDSRTDPKDDAVELSVFIDWVYGIKGTTFES